MKKYRAFINGRNFQILHKSKKRTLGFYATRWFEAENTDDARQVAINMIKNDQELKQTVLNGKEDPPKIYVEKLMELTSFKGLKPPGTGYTFYPEDGLGDDLD